MSKFNKCSLALAVAGALVLPASAFAANAGYPTGTTPAEYTFASNLFGAASSTISNPAAYTITTQASDNIIGRTTGFSVRLTLGNGVRFATGTQAPATGTALVGYNQPLLATVPPAGGTERIVIGVTPDATGENTNVGVGQLLVWAPGAIVLSNLGALATAGTNVPVTIELIDPNSAQVFQVIQGASLATSAEGTTVVFDASKGDINKRIDVATCGDQEARTRFAPNGQIGASCSDPVGVGVFNAGSITIGARGLANGFAGANNSGGATTPAGAGDFQYDVDNDEFSVTVTGTDFGAFNAASGNDRIYLSTNGLCEGNGIEAAIAAGGNSVTFDGLAPATAQGATYNVCLQVADPAVTQIATQQLNASVAIDFASANVIDPADRSGALLALRNNGTVLDFQNVNPAGNARAQSFIRLTNNSALSCPVTIAGRDDNGVAGDSVVSFSLASGQSQTFNSVDLENGSSKGTGAFGDGAGRWYVTVNGECAGLVGSALNRNLDTGTVTNLTPDKRGIELPQQIN